ncbi:unnamed protein product, partial [Linum tenue]
RRRPFLDETQASCSKQRQRRRRGPPRRVFSINPNRNQESTIPFLFGCRSCLL